MREIEFRAWEKASKRMNQNVDAISWHVHSPTVTLSWGGYYTSKLEDGVLMQFIGLKDKNGKEIYEGIFHRQVS